MRRDQRAYRSIYESYALSALDKIQPRIPYFVLIALDIFFHHETIEQ